MLHTLLANIYIFFSFIHHCAVYPVHRLSRCLQTYCIDIYYTDSVLSHCRYLSELQTTRKCPNGPELDPLVCTISDFLFRQKKMPQAAPVLVYTNCILCEMDAGP